MAASGDRIPSGAGVSTLAKELKNRMQVEHEESYTFWLNGHLAKVNVTVTDLQNDLSDGRLFATLVEVLTGEKMPQLQVGNLRLHQIARVNACLDFLAAGFPQLSINDIGAEDIVNGNLKMILGMIHKLQLLEIEVSKMTSVTSVTPLPLLPSVEEEECDGCCPDVEACKKGKCAKRRRNRKRRRANRKRRRQNRQRRKHNRRRHD